MQEINVTDDSTTITVPQRSSLFGVEKKDWNRIQTSINNLSLKSSNWGDAFWFFAGVTVSVFITYLSVDPLNQNKKIFLVSTFFLSIISIILYICNSTLSSHSRNEKNKILDEMKSMETPNINPN